jgi:hypothetical protein
VPEPGRDLPRDPRTDAPARASLPRRTWIALALAGLVVLGLLSTQVVLLTQQLSAIERQKHIAEAARDDSRPLVRRTREALPETLDTVARVDRLTRELTPLARDLRDAGAPEAARVVQRLAATLTQAEIGTRLEEVADATEAGARLARRSLEADLVGHGVRAADDTAELVSLTRRLLATQVEALEVARGTLDQARGARVAAESVDRKLGGLRLPGAR